MLILGILDQGSAAGVGDFESIATVSVTAAGGQADVEFTNIPGDFQHLQIRGIRRGVSGSYQNVIMRMNTDTGANYNWHYLEGVGSGTPISSNSPNDTSIYFMQSSGSTQTADVFGVAVIDILDYANTNKFKTVRSLSGVDNNGDGRIQFWSGAWRNTNAITSIRLVSAPAINFAQHSHFALYGIRG